MKRIIALFITFCLCLSLIPGAVFAGASEEGGGSGKVCKLLVIGDSTTTGYGMPDQVSVNCSFAIGNTDLEGSWTYDKAIEYNKDDSHPARGRMSEIAFPWQLKKYIDSLEGVRQCDFRTMSVDALIGAGVRAMLDPSYYEREIEQEARIIEDGKGPVKDQIELYKKVFYNGGLIPEMTYPALHSYAENEVKNADVIVYDTTMNTMTMLMIRRLSGLVGAPIFGGGSYYKERVSDLEELSDKQRSALKVLREELLDVAGRAGDPLADSVIDTVMYCYADCVISLSENIKTIRRLNPDAKIIVPTLYNAISGFGMKIGDTGVDLEAMYGILAQAVNTYIKVLDENSPNYYVADIPLRIHVVDEEFKEARSVKEFMESEYGQSYLNFLYNNNGNSLCTDGNKEAHKEDIKKLFAEAIINYPMDLAVIMNGKGMDDFKAELMTYYQDKTMPSDSTMTLLHLMSALLLLHPNHAGCIQKFEAIRDAYNKTDTAYEETLHGVLDALRNAAAKVGIKDISDIQRIMALSDLTKEVNMQDLLAVGQAVYGLPEFEKMISSYMDEEKAKTAEAEDRIEALEAQIIELTKTIDELMKEKENKLARAKITSVKPSGKALTVKWKKVTNADGYKVSYKAPGKKAVVKTVKGGSKLSLKLTGLKKKTKYTVKVRAWKKADGKTYYGAWSAAKKAAAK